MADSTIIGADSTIIGADSTIIGAGSVEVTISCGAAAEASTPLPLASPLLTLLWKKTSLYDNGSAIGPACPKDCPAAVTSRESSGGFTSTALVDEAWTVEARPPL